MILRTEAPAERPTGTRRQGSRPALAAGGVACVLVLAAAAFMTWDLRGSLDYALPLRARKLAALALVGTGLGTSAVLFHTITHNRILTPMLLGFGQVYVLFQTTAAWALGTFAYLRLDERIRFGAAVTALVGFALALERTFLRRTAGDLPLLVLTGVVIGATATSLGGLVARMIDPNEYTALQDQFFASFATVDESLLSVSAIAVAGTLRLAWVVRDDLDVVAALGRDLAVGLGVDHRRLTRRTLICVCILVAVPTALVGPMTFLGLLAAHLAYRLGDTFRHRATLPLAGLAGATALVVAQFTLEEFFAFRTRASIVVSVVGGTVFLALLHRETRLGGTR